MRKLTATLFVIVLNQKLPNCPSVGEGTQTMTYPDKEYDAAFKNKALDLKYINRALR